jgi:hypothetical protein
MRASRLTLALGIGACVAVASCNGTTGDQLISFSAYGSGVAGASQPFSAGGYTIQLTSAKMRLGALYFDEAPPGTGFDGPECIASGVYAAQVPGPLEVDLLSTQPQEFAVYGNGTADTAQSWQIWMTDGDVNEVNFAHMVDLEGVATASDGTQTSFGAVVTINDNRLPAVSDPADPGQSPICKQRIIQIGGQALTFFQGGSLLVTVDPRGWFNLGIDFSSLPPVADDACLSGDPQSPMNPADFALAPETPPPASQTCGGSGQPCCASGAACLGALSCTTGVCGPTVCIPNTSFGTGAGAAAGVSLFTGVQTGGPAAYSVSYGQGP